MSTIRTTHINQASYTSQGNRWSANLHSPEASPILLHLAIVPWTCLAQKFQSVELHSLLSGASEAGCELRVGDRAVPPLMVALSNLRAQWGNLLE